MKRFNLMTERQMSRKDGGFVGIAALGVVPHIVATAGKANANNSK